MKFIDAPIGERVVMVEAMNDDRSNEVRHTHYERREGVATFSPKYCLAFSLRLIQGTTGCVPRVDTGENRIITEVHGSVEVVLASSLVAWPERQPEIDELTQLRSDLAAAQLDD